MRKMLEDIPVLYVESESGTAGAREAFDKLEAKLPSFKGRKFYGAAFDSPKTGSYRACVEQVALDDPENMKLKTWTLPGGEYEQQKLKNWNDSLAKVGELVGSIIREHGIDETRPVIEQYVSMRELRILVPVKG